MCIFVKRYQPICAIDRSRCASYGSVGTSIDRWHSHRWIALRYRLISIGKCCQVALSMDRPDLFIEVSKSVSKLPLLKNQLAPILPLCVQAAGLLHQYKSVNCYNCILLLYFRGSGLLKVDKTTTSEDVMPIMNEF